MLLGEGSIIISRMNNAVVPQTVVSVCRLTLSTSRWEGVGQCGCSTMQSSALAQPCMGVGQARDRWGQVEYALIGIAKRHSTLDRISIHYRIIDANDSCLVCKCTRSEDVA